jgi:hypothetical protein
MARKQKAKTKSEWVLFNVFYEDGSQSSNRRVPSAELEGLDGDAPAKMIIETQDREIAERSGKPRSPIKTIKRTGK